MDGLHSLKANTSLEETFRMIDGSIESYEASLLASKSRRNSLVPISSLPPETLCEIFSFAQLHCVDSAGPNHSPLEWINLTYVCRYWRNIALNSPSLWAYLPIGNLKWVQEMLERSKDSGLVIRSDKPHDHSDSKKSGLWLALQQVHRIRELSIRDISTTTWQTLQTNILGKPAPRLEHFCLLAKSHYREEKLFVTKDILCITNRLRHLELSNCGFTWDFYLLRSLTHLTLHEVLRDFMPVGTRFVDILASMLELESLDLYKSLPLEKERQSSWASEDVHFARLRTLHIHDSKIPELEALFRSITFPPTTVVRIVCHDTNSNHEPDFSGIISGLARSYSNANLLMFQNLILRQSIGRYNHQGIRLKLFSEALKHFEMIRHVDATAHLDLAFYSDHEQTDVIIAKVLSDLFASRIPVNDITQVFFAEDIEGLTFKTIAKTFGKLPRVHSVLAASDAARSVLDAMTYRSHFSDTAGSSRNSGRSLSFPCLSFFYLYDITFMEDHVAEDPALSTEILRRSLAYRCKHGTGLDKLTLLACFGVFEEDIWLLEKIVTNVIWDASAYIGARRG
ncbi:hypothetical protein BJ912DRAFT_1042110 [Pholiota molesta]|nr:hypothetical protein BJ912DRAFT_1042110 [Pholiota molesta]